MIFTPEEKQKFAANYPAQPVLFNHQLETHELFTLERLVELSQSLPKDRVEYNSGKVPVSQDPDKTPSNNLSVAETIRSIEENGSWMALKNIETDPAYNDLFETCLGELKQVIGSKTGDMYRKEAFIFITSPGSVTPFHMDPEHNILLQLRGEKTVQVYPANDPKIISQVQHEEFHAGGHRNLIHEKAFDQRATAFTLTPGQALNIPLKAPHWVQNGDKVSISMSITWRSSASDKEINIHLMNRKLRERGFTPAHIGTHVMRDKAKAFGYKVLERFSR